MCYENRYLHILLTKITKRLTNIVLDAKKSIGKTSILKSVKPKLPFRLEGAAETAGARA